MNLKKALAILMAVMFAFAFGTTAMASSCCAPVVDCCGNAVTDCCGGGADCTCNAWWSSLPSAVQFVLRWVLFGWLWM